MRYIYALNRYIMKKILLISIILSSFGLFAQITPVPHSIHKEENDYYRRFSPEELAGMFRPAQHVETTIGSREDCKLEKIVFGFHPYWVEGAQNNYQWDMLSDFCYFNYEVNPATGAPTTIHDWLNAASVDAAHAHGVRVHLTMTLFGNHSQFFNNKSAQRNFSKTIIALLKERKAIGVNLDMELVPKTLKRKMTEFVLFFGRELHREIPGSILSIDIPAVDWSGTFEIAKMNKEVDIFFIMGYDYYYSGSSESGPCGPLYSFVDYYDYNLSRTVSYYQAVGMPLDKMVLGLPYYGKTWKVSKQGAPAKTLAKGTSIFFKDTKNNTDGHFSRTNARWASTSFANYYLYKQSGSWYHSFILNAKEQRYKMDLIRLRGLAGTGMWALGYDDGYSDLWNVLRETMTECYTQPCKGTLYDSGGPFGDYYNSEDYAVLLRPENKGTLNLKFSYLNTAQGEDFLTIYDGESVSAPQIGKYSGIQNIPEIHASGSALYLKFHSNAAGRKRGFKALWVCDTMDVASSNPGVISGIWYEMVPNPSFGKSRLFLYGLAPGSYRLQLSDISGKTIATSAFKVIEERQIVPIDMRGKSPGIYFFCILNNSGKQILTGKFLH